MPTAYSPHAMTLRATVACVIALLLSLTPAADACTTFCVVSGGRVIYGRNYDFPISRGLVMTNPRGVAKSGHLAGGPSWIQRTLTGESPGPPSSCPGATACH